MGSASGTKHQHRQAHQEAKAVKKVPSAASIEPSEDPVPSAPFPNPNPSAAMDLVAGDEDEELRTAESLTREQVLRRRLRRSKQLARMYKDLYWSLMEELKAKHRDYYWHYGTSPFEAEEEEEEDGEEEREGADNVENGGCGGLGKKAPRQRCKFSGCKTNAMPLTSFCHLHILSDKRQTLYKPCNHFIKSSHGGQSICGKPVLRSSVPCFCPSHFQKTQKQVYQALKKAGLGASSSSRPASLFPAIIAESVRQIHAKRRKASNADNQ